MRISDWSSDVCSSDLDLVRGQRSDLLLRPFDGVTVIRTGEQSLMETEHRQVMTRNRRLAGRLLAAAMVAETAEQDVEQIGPRQNGRASGRERVCQYVEISVVAVSLKKK